MKKQFTDKKSNTKKICMFCNHVFEKIGHNQKYHKSCSIKIRKQKMIEYNKKYRLLHKEERLQHLRDMRIEDYHKHKEKRCRQNRRWYQKNKDKAIIYRSNFPIKILVRNETHQKFKRLDYCTLCKCSKSLEIHHFVYKIPVERKHFTTLCKSCHGIIHRSIYHEK